MKNRLVAALAVAIGVLVVPALVVAHHSAANFDMGKQITLQGTVTVFKFVNPHPYVHFQVKDESGNVADWIAETARPPATLYNTGWRPNALKPGDPITITGSPSKDGRKVLQLQKMVTPSGQEWLGGHTEE